jgi:SAM-dependent methyltransferase
VRAVAYYDAIATRYDADVTTSARDRLARRAFVDLVTRAVLPRGRIVDFGCGTGLDAAEYVRLGYSVVAYDRSHGMLEQLQRRCAASIASGQVTVSPPSLAALERTLETAGGAAAIVANFAVLNMVDDLVQLCDLFSRILPRDGVLVVSVLNPWHWREMATPRWWGEALRFSRQTPHRHPQRHFDCYLHFERDVLEAARDFRLCGRARAGSMVRYRPVDGTDAITWTDPALARSIAALAWRTPLARVLGPFLFLVLRRR